MDDESNNVCNNFFPMRMKRHHNMLNKIKSGLDSKPVLKFCVNNTDTNTNTYKQSYDFVTLKNKNMAYNSSFIKKNFDSLDNLEKVRGLNYKSGTKNYLLKTEESVFQKQKKIKSKLNILKEINDLQKCPSAQIVNISNEEMNLNIDEIIDTNKNTEVDDKILSFEKTTSTIFKHETTVDKIKDLKLLINDGYIKSREHHQIKKTVKLFLPYIEKLTEKKLKVRLKEEAPFFIINSKIGGYNAIFEEHNMLRELFEQNRSRIPNVIYKSEKFHVMLPKIFN